MVAKNGGGIVAIDFEGCVLDVRPGAKGLAARPRFALSALPDGAYFTSNGGMVSWSTRHGHANFNGQELGGHICAVEGSTVFGDGFLSWDESGVIQVWDSSPQSATFEDRVEGTLNHRRILGHGWNRPGPS